MNENIRPEVLNHIAGNVYRLSNVGQNNYLGLESSCNILKSIKKILEVINVSKDKNLENSRLLNLSIIKLERKQK